MNQVRKHGHRLFRIIRTKNVFKGFKQYNAPLLLSYSRSGTNWLLYHIGQLTNSPTPSSQTPEGDFLIDRAHMGFSVIRCYDRAILLLRNYKECITRHHGYEQIATMGVSRFLKNDNGRQPAIWYVKNIQQFDRFKGDKMVVFFEDLVESPNDSIKALATFMNVDAEEVNHYLKNMDQHQENSLNRYEKMGHQSQTKGAATNIDFHQRKFSAEQLIEFDDYFQDQLGNEIFQKYLSRYLGN